MENLQDKLNTPDNTNDAQDDTQADVLADKPTYRRIRRGTTIADIQQIRKSKEKGEELPVVLETFTDATVETLLNASNEISIVVNRKTMEIFAVNKATENKLGVHYKDLHSLYPYFSPETLKQITEKTPEITNHIMTISEGQNLAVDIETIPIFWCEQDALLLKIKETESPSEEESPMDESDRIIGGITHDLNNVFNVIIGHLSLLQADGPEQIEPEIQQMFKVAEHGSTLLKEFLVLNSQRELDFTKDNLHEFIRRVVKQVKFWEEEYNIKIRFIENRQPCPCNFDAISIARIVHNLMQNSRDAVGEGGTITVAVRNIDPNDPPNSDIAKLIKEECVCIYVEDNGSGIPKENLDKIYVPEFSTKAHTKNRFGFGLPIVKKIVEQHKGEILIETETGKNSFTRFYILIPKNN